MVTNEYERDLNDTSFLGRPGRIDMAVFQNTPDAGDGYPGLQRAFRNYLHDGGMEDDLDINTHNIDNAVDINMSGELVFPSATIHSQGTQIHIHPNIGNADGNLILHPVGSNTASILYIRNSVTANYGDFIIKVDGAVASLESALGGSGTQPTTLNMNDADWDNINIGDASATITINAVGISATQFGYLGASDQGIAKATSVQFGGLALTGNLTLAANAITGTSVSLTNTKLQQLSNIGAVTVNVTQWGYLGGADQAVKQADSPTFVGLTLSANVITTSTVDGVDVSSLKSDFDTHVGSTGASHTYISQSVTSSATPTFNGLSANSQKITLVGSPTVAADAANFGNILYTVEAPVKGIRFDGNWSDTGEYFDILMVTGVGSLWCEFLVGNTYASYVLKIMYSTTSSYDSLIYYTVGKNNSVNNIFSDQSNELPDGAYLLNNSPAMSLTKGDYLRVELEHKAEPGDSGNLRIYGIWLAGA